MDRFRCLPFVHLCFLCVVVASSRLATAGPFVNLGINFNDPALFAWADGVQSFAPASSGSPPSAAAAALGPAGSGLVSLGDLSAAQIGVLPPGQITLQFSHVFRNGAGWDLAVFENAGTFFTSPFVFGELAYVEVSSNGVDFARFPSTSLNVEPGSGSPDTELNVAFGRNFAGINATNVHNLAGIHPLKVGTAFDLDDLLPHPLAIAGTLDLNHIGYVRLVDIPGNGAFLDSQGRPVLDAWQTGGGSGGFDLDAVGARYLVPEASTAALAVAALVAILVVGQRRNARLRQSL